MSGEQRKDDHIRLTTEADIRARFNAWDQVRLVHDALPELDFADLDLGVELFGRHLGAPLVISGMTGGTEMAAKVNANLATAAAEHQVAMGVGSQRPALQGRADRASFALIKDHDIPLRIANLGIPQFLDQASGTTLTIEHAREAMDMVDAHLLAIHLNWLQEMAQPEGDRKARGGLERLTGLCSELPILAKETGAGVGRRSAERLKEAGVRGIDVGGMGGTSFAAVEALRADRDDASMAWVGREFWDWGIPTPVAVIESQVGLPVIATGGLRHGTDAARALALGASAAGFAGELIKVARVSAEATSARLGELVHGLKVAMFLTGCARPGELRERRTVLGPELRVWLDGHV